MVEAGEVLVRRRLRRSSDGLAVPLQLQVLEADLLDATKSGAIGAGRPVHGIEFDPVGKRRDYWLHAEHPGDAWGALQGGLGLHAVPVELIEQIYEIGRRSAEAVDLVNDHHVDQPVLDILQQPLRSGALQRAAGGSASATLFADQHPAPGRPIWDERFAGLPLGVERVELLLQPFLGGFPDAKRTLGVDSAAGCLSCSEARMSRPPQSTH